MKDIDEQSIAELRYNIHKWSVLRSAIDASRQTRLYGNTVLPQLLDREQALTGYRYVLGTDGRAWETGKQKCSQCNWPMEVRYVEGQDWVSCQCIKCNTTYTYAEHNLALLEAIEHEPEPWEEI